MQLLKRSYAGAMHVIAGLGPLEKLIEGARVGDAYSWRHWAVSLLAIHDIKRMVALGLPWWNVSATRVVEEHLASRPGARVFEYGAGASTAWLSRRADTVISVEHHPEWHNRLMIEGFPNANIWLRALDDGAYVGAIDEAGGYFDLIVIDGRRRVECLQRAVSHLKSGGIVLFDNSGRHRYRPGIESCGLKEHRYFGRTYCLPYPDFSSVLYG